MCRELNNYNLQQTILQHQKTLTLLDSLSNLAQLTLECIASYNKETTELVHTTITIQ